MGDQSNLRCPLLWTFILGLAGCGGNGSGPTTPTAGPAPTQAPTPVVVNDMSSAGSPPFGSTMAVTACVDSTGACARVTVNVTTTFNAPVTGGQIYVQLLDASGRQCASAFSSAISLAVGSPLTVSVTPFMIECSLPFTTTVVRSTLYPANPGNLPVAQRKGLYVERFTAGWTFVASASVTPTLDLPARASDFGNETVVPVEFLLRTWVRGIEKDDGSVSHARDVAWRVGPDDAGLHVSHAEYVLFVACPTEDRPASLNGN